MVVPVAVTVTKYTRPPMHFAWPFFVVLVTSISQGDPNGPLLLAAGRGRSPRSGGGSVEVEFDAGVKNSRTCVGVTSPSCWPSGGLLCRMYLGISCVP